MASDGSCGVISVGRAVPVLCEASFGLLRWFAMTAYKIQHFLNMFMSFMYLNSWVPTASATIFSKQLSNSLTVQYAAL